MAIGGVLLAGAGLHFTRTPLWSIFGADEAKVGEVTLPWLVSIVAAVVTAASGVEYCVRAFPLLRRGAPRA
jgi:hypothetical protein